MKKRINLGLLGAIVFTASFMGAPNAFGGQAPYYPSVTLKTVIESIDGNECVARVDLPSEGGFRYIDSGSHGGKFEGTLAGYLEYYAHYVAAYGNYNLPSDAIKTMTIPFVVRNREGELSIKKITTEVIVSPVKQGDTEASLLTLEHLLPISETVDAVLGGMPKVLGDTANSLISRWNIAMNEAKSRRQARATLKVSEVTESRIRAALTIVGGAQAIALAQYACPDTDVQKYSVNVRSYLLRVTEAFEALNKK